MTSINQSINASIGHVPIVLAALHDHDTTVNLLFDATKDAAAEAGEDLESTLKLDFSSPEAFSTSVHKRRADAIADFEEKGRQVMTECDTRKSAGNELFRAKKYTEVCFCQSTSLARSSNTMRIGDPRILCWYRKRRRLLGYVGTKRLPDTRVIGYLAEESFYRSDCAVVQQPLYGSAQVAAGRNCTKRRRNSYETCSEMAQSEVSTGPMLHSAGAARRSR